jgi:CBS domain containing-hemolysin-like protein
MAMETLPIFLHKIVPAWAAILVSTVAILIVGEIVPMSFFTGPNKVQIAYFFSPLVVFLMKATWIFNYPCAMLLDRMFGEGHGLTKYGVADIKALLSMHVKEEHDEHGEMT